MPWFHTPASNHRTPQICTTAKTCRLHTVVHTQCITPMTAIPVLFHREIESQTVEFQSMGLGMCVSGDRVRYGMLASEACPSTSSTYRNRPHRYPHILIPDHTHLPQNIVPHKSAQQGRHVDCIRLCTPNGNPHDGHSGSIS